MIFEIVKLIIYTLVIVSVSKYLLSPTLRRLASILKLKPKNIGEISGYTTSMPELLTIVASSSNGLIETSMFNILSSNIINFIEYFGAIIKSKNINSLKDKGIRICLLLVIMTILIPVLIILFDVGLNLILIPIFIMFFILFTIIENLAHRKYLENIDEKLEQEIECETKINENDKIRISKYIIILMIVVIILFIISNNLGDTLEVLSLKYNIPEFIMGIFLGFLTSIPELITFIDSQRHHNKTKKRMLGVVEATNNLLTSNMINLFVIETVALLLYMLFS